MRSEILAVLTIFVALVSGLAIPISSSSGFNKSASQQHHPRTTDELKARTPTPTTALSVYSHALSVERRIALGLVMPPLKMWRRDALAETEAVKNPAPFLPHHRRVPEQEAVAAAASGTAQAYFASAHKPPVKTAAR